MIMKAFTDISQSRKLAEILPLESADMYYFLDPTPAGNIYHIVIPQIDFGIKTREPEYDKGDIPCWSLAALMDVIPYNISFNKAVYRFKMVKYSEHWECYHENFGSVSTEIFKGNNQIDVCMAMIEKLHEQNLM